MDESGTHAAVPGDSQMTTTMTTPRTWHQKNMKIIGKLLAEVHPHGLCPVVTGFNLQTFGDTRVGLVPVAAGGAALPDPGHGDVTELHQKWSATPRGEAKGRSPCAIRIRSLLEADYARRDVEALNAIWTL